MITWKIKYMKEKKSPRQVFQIFCRILLHTFLYWNSENMKKLERKFPFGT